MNAVYSKFIENQREQSEIRYIQNGSDALVCLNSPLTKVFKIINEGLMIFEQKKKKVVLNRPIQLGVTILEYAKLIMFSYYHDILKKTFGDRISLLYTDTDSFVLELWSRDLLADLKCIGHTLPTSNFPPKEHYLSSLYTGDYASELFYFKSEVGGAEIIAFSAVRAKVYS